MINIAVLHNMTDEELLKVCVFNKPESELMPTEHLLVEMAKRLEIAKSETETFQHQYTGAVSEVSELHQRLVKLHDQSEELEKDGVTYESWLTNYRGLHAGIESAMNLSINFVAKHN